MTGFLRRSPPRGQGFACLQPAWRDLREGERESVALERLLGGD